MLAMVEIVGSVSPLSRTDNVPLLMPTRLANSAKESPWATRVSLILGPTDLPSYVMLHFHHPFFPVGQLVFLLDPLKTFRSFCPFRAAHSLSGREVLLGLQGESSCLTLFVRLLRAN